MNRKYDLQDLIAALLSGRKMSLDTVVARAELNFEWISQTLQFNAETIYRFCVDNNSENICVFLSEPLLKHQGTLIYSYTDSTDFSHPDMKRRMELWILDDMTFAVVSCVRMELESGELISEYRLLKTKDRDIFPQVIDLNYNLLVIVLDSLCLEHTLYGTPIYEL